MLANFGHIDVIKKKFQKSIFKIVLSIYFGRFTFFFFFTVKNTFANEYMFIYVGIFQFSLNIFGTYVRTGDGKN